ncbi:hypothetical protein F5884DRAFT_764906 [Xylogone sp. PMI_703]|nr:hypothetical protein F5884DRAFT_764906 [Xylogone sp. PMI_703]
MVSTQSIHVLIIGGGITGLLLAHGLKKHGIRTSVYEKELSSDVRRRDWTLAIHWSIPLLEELLPQSIWNRLHEAHCDPFYEYPEVEVVPLTNGQTGELLMDIRGAGMRRFSRNRLRKLCTEGLEIEYGKEFVNATYSEDGSCITAHFTDGTLAEGDVLIGTDGVDSVVRTFLVGEENAPRLNAEYALIGTLVNYSDAEKARHVRNNSVSQMSWSPDGTFSFISVENVLDPADPNTWTFQLNCSWHRSTDIPQDSSSILAAVKGRHENKSEPFRSAYAWLPENHPMYSNEIKYWLPSPWDNHNGRITLAGDAAHPMPPYRGQGLNHSICDVSKLMNGLISVNDKRELPEVIKVYEEEMIPRTKAETESSVENMILVHDWEKIKESPMMKVGIAKTS